MIWLSKEIPKVPILSSYKVYQVKLKEYGKKVGTI